MFVHFAQTFFIYIFYLTKGVVGCYTISTDNGVGVSDTTRIAKKGFSIKCDKVLDKCVWYVVEREVKRGGARVLTE